MNSQSIESVSPEYPSQFNMSDFFYGNEIDSIPFFEPDSLFGGYDSLDDFFENFDKPLDETKINVSALFECMRDYLKLSYFIPFICVSKYMSTMRKDLNSLLRRKYPVGPKYHLNVRQALIYDEMLYNGHIHGFKLTGEINSGKKTLIAALIYKSGLSFELRVIPCLLPGWKRILRKYKIKFESPEGSSNIFVNPDPSAPTARCQPIIVNNYRIKYRCDNLCRLRVRMFAPGDLWASKIVLTNSPGRECLYISPKIEEIKCHPPYHGTRETPHKALVRTLGKKNMVTANGTLTKIFEERDNIFIGKVLIGDPDLLVAVLKRFMFSRRKDRTLGICTSDPQMIILAVTRISRPNIKFPNEYISGPWFRKLVCISHLYGEITDMKIDRTSVCCGGFRECLL